MLKAGVAGLLQWTKALYGDAHLRELATGGGKRYDYRSLAVCIANHGASGRGCFASKATLAAEFGASERTVESMRQELIRLGWFTVKSKRGGKTGRALVLDIAIPEFDPWAEAYR